MQTESLIKFKSKEDAQKCIPYRADWIVRKFEHTDEFIIYDRVNERYVTDFRLFLIDLVKQTHRSRDGVMRAGSWRKYEETYAGVGGYGDYSGHSTEHRSAIDLLEKCLSKFEEANETHKHYDYELYTLFHWPHHGRDIVICVLDAEYGLPTTMAYWFFHQSPFPDYFKKSAEIAYEYGKRSWSRFVAEFVHPNGTVKTGDEVLSGREYFEKYGYPKITEDPNPSSIKLESRPNWPNYQFVLENGRAPLDGEECADAYDEAWLMRNIETETDAWRNTYLRYQLSQNAYDDYDEFMSIERRHWWAADEPYDVPFEDKKLEDIFLHIVDFEYYTHDSNENSFYFGRKYDDHTVRFVLAALAIMNDAVDMQAVDDWLPDNVEHNKKALFSAVKSDFSHTKQVYNAVMFWMLGRTPVEILRNAMRNLYILDRELVAALKFARRAFWKTEVLPNWGYYNADRNRHSRNDGKRYKTKSEALRKFMRGEEDFFIPGKGRSATYPVYILAIIKVLYRYVKND